MSGNGSFPHRLASKCTVGQRQRPSAYRHRWAQEAAGDITHPAGVQWLGTLPPFHRACKYRKGVVYGAVSLDGTLFGVVLNGNQFGGSSILRQTHTDRISEDLIAPTGRLSKEASWLTAFSLPQMASWSTSEPGSRCRQSRLSAWARGALGGVKLIVLLEALALESKLVKYPLVGWRALSCLI